MPILGMFEVTGKSQTTKSGSKYRLTAKDEFENVLKLAVSETEFEQWEVEDLINLRKFLHQSTLDESQKTIDETTQKTEEES